MVGERFPVGGARLPPAAITRYRCPSGAARRSVASGGPVTPACTVWGVVMVGGGAPRGDTVWLGDAPWLVVCPVRPRVRTIRVSVARAMRLQVPGMVGAGAVVTGSSAGVGMARSVTGCSAGRTVGVGLRALRQAGAAFAWRGTVAV